jgi:hypothetical protein
MNAVEIYKRLPRKNCGKCRQKTCMPFAFSLISGDADLIECPELSEDAIIALKGSFQKSDWREELIAKLRKEVAEMSFSEIAAGLGAVIRDDCLVIRSLGRDFIMTRDGEISTNGHITLWMKILLLHYVRTRGQVDLSNQWVSYSELKSGMVKALSFRRECEDPLRELLDRDLNRVADAMSRMGATQRNGFEAHHAWHVLLLPKIPVLILYWPKEEEFESRVSILFDSTADRFLDIESLMFLGEGFIENIETYLYQQEKAQ